MRMLGDLILPRGSITLYLRMYAISSACCIFCLLLSAAYLIETICVGECFQQIALNLHVPHFLLLQLLRILLPPLFISP